MDEVFRQQVYDIVRLIPKGRLCTYGTIAKAVGFPNHARQVGKAMGGCPKDVPAHRVVNSAGKLSVPSFRERLEKENIEVKANGSIKNFRKLFWDPFQEI